MPRLRALQKATTLHDLAVILNYSPTALAYLLYKKTGKYSRFQIPKKNGTPREILAPCDELKSLQRKLKKLLDECLESIEKKRSPLGSLSHGFKANHSIITNAEPHRKRLYVFNVDIKGFFDSIHMGRIRGFFISNKDFNLNTKTATILAQIICHDDKLPQGSPASPVASNLIGHLIDIRMVQLAKRLGCTYSRYADDITFSTNKSEFPPEIAYRLENSHDWIPGGALLKVIYKSGFGLNHEKTRMQYARAQQTVTGLVVNQSTNTPAEFRRKVRAMTHKLFMDGEYYVHEENGPRSPKKTELNHSKLNKLEGMYSYIYMTDCFNRKKIIENSNRRHEDFPLSSLEKLHGDFLFYKNFYASPAPTIICEGKTDNIYLTCAIKSLHEKFPRLAKPDASGKVKLKVRFINYSELTHRVMGLNGGSSDLGHLIRRYAKQCGSYKAHPPLNPTIIVVDNDSGSQPIFQAIKDVTGDRYSIPSGKGKIFDKSQTLYKVAQNLYVVLTPLLNGKDSMMEDFFPPAVLRATYNGKSFEAVSPGPKGTTYSKHQFSQHVVKPNQKIINFSRFSHILKSINLAIRD
ncbi:MAG: ribonuclease H, partial [Acinetobacter sp. RIFCSPHIGHO2_12_41_5]